MFWLLITYSDAVTADDEPAEDSGEDETDTTQEDETDTTQEDETQEVADLAREQKGIHEEKHMTEPQRSSKTPTPLQAAGHVSSPKTPHLNSFDNYLETGPEDSSAQSKKIVFIILAVALSLVFIITVVVVIVAFSINID